MRMSLLDVDDLDPELREGLTRWLAEGGDPNFYTAGSPGPRRAPHEGAGPAAPGSAQPVPLL